MHLLQPRVLSHCWYFIFFCILPLNKFFLGQRSWFSQVVMTCVVSCVCLLMGSYSFFFPSFFPFMFCVRMHSLSWHKQNCTKFLEAFKSLGVVIYCIMYIELLFYHYVLPLQYNFMPFSWCAPLMHLTT